MDRRERAIYAWGRAHPAPGAPQFCDLNGASMIDLFSVEGYPGAILRRSIDKVRFIPDVQNGGRLEHQFMFQFAVHCLGTEFWQTSPTRTCTDWLLLRVQVINRRFDTCLSTFVTEVSD